MDMETGWIAFPFALDKPEYRLLRTGGIVDPQKDLVDKYDLAYPSIRSRIQRGRDKLKQILLNCCNVEQDNRGNILEVKRKTDCQPGASNFCRE